MSKVPPDLGKTRNFEIREIYRNLVILMVARGRIELPTRGFSVLCSTD